MFFVVSAFLYTIILDRQEIHYGKFLCNRILRLFPLYILFFAIRVSLSRYSIDMIKDLFSFPGGTWIIPVEIVFYLLAPFLLQLENRKKSLLWIILAIFMGKIASILNTGENVFDFAYFNIFWRFDQFLVGMLFATWYNEGKFEFLKRTNILNVLAIPFLYVFHVIGVEQFHDNEIVVLFLFQIRAMVMSFIAVLYMYSNIFSRWNRILKYIGSLTYGIFLFHSFFVSAQFNGERILHISTGNIFESLINTLFIVLPISILFSYITKKAIEEPLEKFKIDYKKI